MSETRIKMIFESLKLTYLKRFKEKLKPQLLCEVLEQELKFKKLDFLKAHLQLSELNLKELLLLRSLSEEELLKKTPLENKHLPETKLKSLSLEGHQEAEKLLFEETKVKTVDLDELLSEKRRAYARTYYHKKKSEKDPADPKNAKLFKTSPEQRAYQKSYYLRKKNDLNLQDLDSPKISESLDKKTKLSTETVSTQYTQFTETDRLAIDAAFKTSFDDNNFFDTRPKQNNAGELNFQNKTKLRKSNAHSV